MLDLCFPAGAIQKRSPNICLDRCVACDQHFRTLPKLGQRVRSRLASQLACRRPTTLPQWATQAVKPDVWSHYALQRDRLSVVATWPKSGFAWYSNTVSCPICADLWHVMNRTPALFTHAR